MVHNLGAALDHRPELLAVDGLVTMVERWPTSREMLSIGTLASRADEFRRHRQSTQQNPARS